MQSKYAKLFHTVGFSHLWIKWQAKQKHHLLRRNSAALSADPFFPPFPWPCSLVRDSLLPSRRSLPHSGHIPPLLMLGGRLLVAKSIVGNPSGQAFQGPCRPLRKKCARVVSYSLSVQKALSASHLHIYYPQAKKKTLTSIINVLILSLRTNSKETLHMHISSSSQYTPRCAKPQFRAVRTLDRKGIKR